MIDKHCIHTFYGHRVIRLPMSYAGVSDGSLRRAIGTYLSRENDNCLNYHLQLMIKRFIRNANTQL